MGYPTTVDTGQVTPWLLGAPEINSAASNGVLAANSVYLYVFELMAPVTVTSMRWRMGATATGTSDLGIYDGNGNLLGHTGASTNTASTLMTVALTGGNLALSPGRYSLALCPSNATDTYFRANNMAQSVARCYIATNAGTAGVLPATTGAQTSTTACPVLAGIVSGGAL